MTDLPWAVAWYGDRHCVWLPLKYRSGSDEKGSDDFFGVYRRLPVSALYLTARTLKSVDAGSITQYGSRSEAAGDWTSFALGTYLQGEVPAGFPLRFAPEGLGAEIFLTDSER